MVGDLILKFFFDPLRWKGVLEEVKGGGEPLFFAFMYWLGYIHVVY